MEKFPITSKGFKKLETELKFLKSSERPNVIKAIAEARAHGDLSENAEYHAAKEKQSFIEGRIADLENKEHNESKSEVIFAEKKEEIPENNSLEILEDKKKELTELINNNNIDNEEVKIISSLEKEDFVDAMNSMANLRTPIDNFFETVQINSDVDVIRRNRLNLLSRICKLCLSVADLTKVKG